MVPEHWEVQNLGSLAKPISIRGRPDLPLLSVVREKGVIHRASMAEGENHNSIPDDLGNYRVVREGDLVINKMKAWQGSLGLAPTEGIVSPAYYVFEFGMANRRFGQMLLRSKSYVAFFAQASDGVRVGQWDLSISGLKRIPVLVPSTSEQAAIVRFLDHADRQIRGYVRSKQSLVRLLEEQKRTLIHQAVTRGFDSDVRLKPSGEEWLGPIPLNWEVLSLRRLVSFVTSGSRGWAAHYSDTGDIFLQSGNLGRSMALDLSRIQHVSLPQGSEGERTRVQFDDVLVCITGALTGNVVHVDRKFEAPAFVNQHVALVRAKPRSIYPRYLAFVLHSEVGRSQFKIGEYGGTKQGLGLDDVKSVLVPVPPMEEQVAICSRLDVELGQTLKVIDGIGREIALLRELRTRLIADVVTGKLDVRQAAANLPDAPDDGDALDAADVPLEGEFLSDDTTDVEALNDE
jgi:type I restriction enzyme S subunit